MRWVPTILVCLMLAGCSEEGPPPDEDDPFDDLDDGPVASDKGVIRGIVFDSSIMPIEGATIALQAGGETKSNAEGAFLFKDLDPGLHFLSVTKVGYASVQQSTEVEAGVQQPPIVKVQLQQMPGTEPRAETFQDRGYISCGWGVPITYGFCGQYTGGTDDFRLQYMVNGDPVWVQVEVIWKSSQAASPNLYMINALCPAENQNSCPGSTSAGSRWDEGTYENPAIMRTPSGFMEGALDRFGQDSTDGWWVGVDVSADGPALATGVTIEQEFYGYVTMFWNIDPDEDWTFYEDGEYPVPDS